MINKKIIWALLIGIVILAAVLRLWQLGSVPPSPDWDEVALGYDAYSIIHTGRDEFGKFLPVVLRSFDDYKPALYAYLTIPSVLAFGLTVFAVRLPSAIFGTLSVLALFFLIRELFSEHKYKDYFGLLASFFLAISPWSIQFSRVGFEANVGVALNMFAVLFFLKAFKNPINLYISAFFAGLSIYVYQSEKAFVPLLFLALALIYRKKLLGIGKKHVFAAVVFGLIVVSPMVFYIIGNRAALLRVTGTSIFTYKTEILKTEITKLQRDQASGDIVGLILDNRRITYAKTIIGGYLSHFDPNWLFVSGDIARHHAPGMGLLYLFEFPLLILGIYMLLFGDFDKRTKLIIFSWFLLAPVPASITTEVPHAVRTLNFLPTFQIFSALGLFYLIYIVNKYRKTRVIFYLVFCLIFILNFSYYLNQYFVQLNYYDSADWQYGYKQAVEEVSLLADKYKEIVVSDNQPMDKSYMFFLFYLKYPPQEYQKIGDKSAGGYAAHHTFGKYTFRPIDWQKDSTRHGVLYIGSPGEIPNGVSVTKTIYDVNGKPAILIVGT